MFEFVGIKHCTTQPKTIMTLVQNLEIWNILFCRIQICPDQYGKCVLEDSAISGDNLLIMANGFCSNFGQLKQITCKQKDAVLQNSSPTCTVHSVMYNSTHYLFLHAAINHKVTSLLLLTVRGCKRTEKLILE